MLDVGVGCGIGIGAERDGYFERLGGDVLACDGGGKCGKEVENRKKHILQLLFLVFKKYNCCEQTCCSHIYNQ